MTRLRQESAWTRKRNLVICKQKLGSVQKFRDLLIQVYGNADSIAAVQLSPVWDVFILFCHCHCACACVLIVLWSVVNIFKFNLTAQLFSVYLFENTLNGNFS